MFGQTYNRIGMIFFWLTGEMPTTLNVQVTKLEPTYINLYGRRMGHLDFKNKVHSHVSVHRFINKRIAFINTCTDLNWVHKYFAGSADNDLVTKISHYVPHWNALLCVCRLCPQNYTQNDSNITFLSSSKIH